MRQAFHPGPIRRSVGLPGCYRPLDVYGPRFDGSANHEICNARTGYCAPTSLSNEMRSSNLFYRLHVSGLHFDTTEEGLRHIFSNYGNPMSVSMIRSRNQQLTAFVEFESQYEADNAIMGLHLKPPLNWEVNYTRSNDEVPNHCRRFPSPTMTSGRQPLMYSDMGLHSSNSRQSPRFIEMRGTDSSMVIRPIRNNSMTPEFPTCSVCSIEALLVCTICKTRYCSPRCQRSDWPSHQSICKPIPDLVTELPDAFYMNGIGSTTLRSYPNMQNGRTSVAIQQSHDTSSEEFEGSNQLLSVTVHRNLENGSSTKMCLPEVRSVQSVSNTINPTPQGSSLRSPEWKTNSSQCKLEISGATSSVSNGAPFQNNPSNERQREAHWGLPAVSKPRNLPLTIYCPETPDSPPSHMASQIQSTDAIKLYAAKFSSKQLEKPLDKRNKVVVCSAKSPDELWVQYVCYREELEKVMRNVAVSSPDSDPVINPVEGRPCVAVFPEDSSWYRAQILKVLPGKIKIRYVDFGNTISMPNTPESLRKMEHHISEPPFYATKVKLADVLPLNGTSWEPDVRLKFKELVENQPFLMEVVQMDAGVMCVRLKDQNGLNLSTRLLQEDLVRKATVEISDELDRIPSVVEIPPKSTAQQLSVQKPPICSQIPNENVATEINNIFQITSRLNGFRFKKLICASAPSCEVKSEIVSSVVPSVKSKDEVVPEKSSDILQQPSSNVFPTNKSENSSPNAVSGPNKVEGTSNANTASEIFYSDGPFLDLPESGSFRALIIKVEDPKRIYLRVTSEEISTKLAQLEDAMVAYANDLGGSHCPKKNEVCIVRFPNGQWYRAYCAGLDSDGNRYIFQQVDYGEKHTVVASDIRCISKSLVNFLPFLAHLVILKGTESMDEIEPKLVNRLKKLLHENTVHDVVVVSCDERSYIVQIPLINQTLSFEGLI
ncbi:uncharacterized protein LOC124209928 isoform X5 [Daphnia pulex]|uniref:uncharacterized protein LOC124209928 isoform X5 n=1 Tax=Daphnia pulex TaxID=6669 RepID=UPI001EDD88DF|nr:uncharacterized protein LOC124209928 isoform X5 [Daphnia pulex]